MESATLKKIIWHPYIQDIPRFTLVFVIILVSAKFGQYLFFEFKTSPAILWPPAGIGVAIMWLYGYRYALPIGLGLLIASITGPAAHYFPGVITTPLSQVLGQIIGVYLLRRFKFEGGFTNIRTVLVFFASIVLLALVSPAISTTISYFMGTLSSTFVQSFGRLWAGYAFSCLILTPFIIVWSLKEPESQNSGLIETTFVGALITVGTYLLFWTRLPAQYGFLTFGLFLLGVIWVCLRCSPRIVTLSVVYVTVIGILGLFLSPAPDQPLNSQLFATELFFFLIIPIMYAYSALVKERHKNVEELKLAFARIEVENDNKSNFIAVLAHELRNPLAPIKTTLEIMKLQKIQPEIEPLVSSAYNQVHVMRRLLDDLLDVTRVTQGKFELKRENVQLISMIHNVIEATKTVVSEYGHTLVFETNPTGTHLVHVDPIRFEQVLVNIINNAAKFTDPGGEIKITSTVAEDTLELRIQDSGKGIEADNLESIFNSFWQIRDSSHSYASGIGVGLALSKQIMELHNGSIRAESKGLGHGSTFIITIPCIKAASSLPEKKKDETIITETYSLLVVDDNKPAVNALAQLLSMKGHTVYKAFCGLEAMEALNANTPDIVLLDIGLPDMSGYEVARSMRQRGFRGGLMALSGYGQPDDIQKASNAGFDHHFTKPLAISTLESYLQSWTKKV